MKTKDVLKVNIKNVFKTKKPKPYIPKVKKSKYGLDKADSDSDGDASGSEGSVSGQ